MYEGEIYTKKVFTKNKFFYIDLKKNQAGFFVKISETANDKKSFIFIPAEGVEDFAKAFNKINEILLQESDTWCR